MAVHLATLFLERAHAVAEGFLILLLVRVGDHEGHERARLCRLGARRAGLRKNRVGDLVEERDVLRREASDGRAIGGRPASPLARREQ
jgi:hypothetical protein